MKNYKPIYQKYVMALLMALSAYVATFAVAGSASAETWTECATEGGSCWVGASSSQSYVIRFGAKDSWSYLYNSGRQTQCSTGVFGDPLSGTVKKCYYSIDALDRSGDINVLHSIEDTGFGLSPEDYLASSLSEGESILGFEGNYWLEMTSLGRLVIMQGGIARWATPDDPTRNASDVYSFHMVGNGMEVRKNGTVFWSKYPQGAAADDTNYAIELSQNGHLYLIDMDERRTRWVLSDYTGWGDLRSSSVSEAAIERIWARTGWDHTADWDADDHALFSSQNNAGPQNNPGSHVRFHRFHQAMHSVNQAVGNVEVDGWDEMKKVFGVSSDGTLAAQETAAMRAMVNGAKNAKAVSEFALGMGKLANHIHDGELELDKLFEGAMDDIINETAFTDQEYDKIVSGLEADSKSQGRRLAKDSTEANCRKLCRFLSRDHNQDKRIDYAVELAADSIKEGTEALGYLSGGWADQLQFRLILTHPRVNGEGRMYQEIRLRVLDYAGIYISFDFKTDTIKTNFTPDVGAAVVHDIIIPFSWETNETWSDRRREGLKYMSMTGVLAEVALATTNVNLMEVFKLGTHSPAVADLLREGTGGLGTPPLPAPEGGAIELTNLGAPSVVATSDTASSSIASSATTDGVQYNAAKNQFTNRFGGTGSVAFEFGTGIGAVFVYDLNRMTELTIDKFGNLTRLGIMPTSVGGILSHIMTVEILGEVGAVALGYWSGLNEAGDLAAAKADDWRAALTLHNLEWMAGGFAGDLLYYGMHRAIYGNTKAIWVGSDAFFWGAARAGLSYNLDGIPGAFRNVFGANYSGGLQARVRFQYNRDYFSREWFARNDDESRFSEYGNLQLTTKRDKCVGHYQNRFVQRSCTGDSFTRLATNFIGEDDIYEIRSQYSGKCVAIPDASYATTNDEVPNGTDLLLSACDTVRDISAVRWHVKYLGHNRVQLQSTLDPRKCVDLAGGSNAENAAMHMWDCDETNKNQWLTIAAQSGIRNTVGGHTIRMVGDQCVSNKAYSNAPSRGELFNVQGCNNRPEQNYRFVNAGDGYYTITMASLNRVLDVVSGSNSNNAAVQAEVSDNGYNQHWKPIVSNDGKVQLQARHSGKCLQLNGDDTPGGRLVQSSCSAYGKATQQFIISSDRFSFYKGRDTSPHLGVPLLFTGSKQSSNYQDSNTYGPDRAYDGRKDGVWNRGLTTTKPTQHAYWQGDLGERKTIDTVTLYNRIDCCAERLKNFYILTSDVDLSGLSLANARQSANEELFISTAVPSESSGNNSVMYQMPIGTVGRYVMVKYNHNDYLTLAEVEVRGAPIAETPLVFTSASQKDTWQNNNTAHAGALKAIDGNTDGNWSGNAALNSVTHTGSSSNTWWQGDFGVSKTVSSVTLYNRVNCCAGRLADFFILVTNTPTTGQTLAQARASARSVIHTSTVVPSSNAHNFTTYNFPINTTGRYVTVYKEGNSYLSLAEVEAKGSN